jgi:hypothetical protein
VQSPLETARLFADWGQIVGDEVAAKCRPTSLKEGVLKVRVTSAIWASELRYLAALLIERVNTALGQPLVTEIKPWVAQPEASEDRSSTTPAPTPAKTIEPGVVKDSEAALVGTDKALAEAFRRALKAAAKAGEKGPNMV